jgi:hypothetical protein
MKTKHKYDKNEFFNDISFEDYTDNNTILSQTVTKSYVDNQINQTNIEHEINYFEYIAEQLNTCINYSEYVNENLNTNISYSEYN